MSVTIILDDHLAERLGSQARIRKLSMQQWALAILANASERPDQPQTWTELNARRLELIRKRHTTALDETEETELEALQDATATMFEPADLRRLEHVQSLAQKTTESPDE